MDSEREVVPAACRPAKRTAVLTWAEGMGVSKAMAVSGPPWMVMGAWPESRLMFAPIWVRGLRMRSMGRWVREWSPMRVKVWGCGAMRPASMRMVEPELPQSSGPAGEVKEPAVPVISMWVGVCSMRAPRAAMQARELWGSAPVEKLERRVVPSARPASMA